MVHAVDNAAATLHRLRWSAGDAAFFLAPQLVWFVFARRDEQNIVARVARNMKPGRARQNRPFNSKRLAKTKAWRRLRNALSLLRYTALR